MVKRQIVRIEEELCNGCGLCVTPCAEGAIELVDGKARVVSDSLCDGAGFCLAVCPTGALSIEVREAEAFDAAAAEERIEANASAAQQGQFVAQQCFRCEIGEDRAILLPCRSQGRSLWVCTRCLPALIHG